MTIDFNIQRKTQPLNLSANLSLKVNVATIIGFFLSAYDFFQRILKRRTSVTSSWSFQGVEKLVKPPQNKTLVSKDCCETYELKQPTDSTFGSF
jgi:hypothetical protein